MPDAKTRSGILLVSERDLADGPLANLLIDHGYRVIHAESTDAALDKLGDANAMLVAFPTAPAAPVEFIDAVRRASAIPIVVIHMQKDQTAGIEALEAGADDFVCGGNNWADPGSTARRELLARLASCLRSLARRDGEPEANEIVFGSLVVRLHEPSVWVRGEEAQITRNEVRLLRVLARARGQLVGHDTLLEAVWGFAGRDQRHYLHVHISRLRQRLDRLGADVEIRTHSGRGYELRLRVESESEG